MKPIPRFSFIAELPPVEGLRKLQDNIINAANPVITLPLLDGRFVTADIAVTATKVTHMLGRAYQGWLIVDKDASSIVYRDDTSTEDTSKFLVLIGSAATTVKLWVF